MFQVTQLYDSSLYHHYRNFIIYRDGKEYALKQIEGTGISMSACREIAVSLVNTLYFMHQ